MPGVLHAQSTYYRVENTKAEGELTKPYFCIQAGLIVAKFCFKETSKFTLQ
jgi:hypothetical protein